MSAGVHIAGVAVRLPMLKTIEELTQSIVIETLFANQLSDLSEELRDSGKAAMADDLLTTVRAHRVAALRIHGQLHALKHQYRALYQIDV